MTTVSTDQLTPTDVDVLSVVIDESTVIAHGMVTRRTVELLLALLDQATRTIGHARLDLTAVSTLDSVAARALRNARADAQATGSGFTVIAPPQVRRQLVAHGPIRCPLEAHHYNGYTGSGQTPA